MGIVVIGDVFIDIKGYSLSPYIPQGRNAGTVIQIHGGVARNVAENMAEDCRNLRSAGSSNHLSRNL